MTDQPVTDLEKSLRPHLLDTQSQLFSRLRYLFVACAGALVLAHTFLLSFVEKIAAPADPNAACLVLAALIGLCLTNRNAARRKLAIALLFAELFLVPVAAALGVSRLFTMLYVLLAAQCALVAGLRVSGLFLLSAVVAHLGGKLFHYWLTERAFFELSFMQQVTHLLVFGRVINFAFAIILAMIALNVLVSERTTRLLKEQKNTELEDLCKQLERKRMAREIHDTVGHLMTSLCMNLDVALHVVGSAPEKCNKFVSRCSELSITLRKDIAKLLQDTPEPLQLGQLIDDLLGQYKRDAVFEIEKELDLPELSNMATHQVFYAVKEALHNVRKYAHASRVDISSGYEQDWLLINIKDNGLGFDMTSVKATSYGLKGMRERLESVRGEVSIKSAPERGTTVSIRVPIK